MAIYCGKIHYKWWFSIVMLNYQRVSVVHKNPHREWHVWIAISPSGWNVSRQVSSQTAPGRAARAHRHSTNFPPGPSHHGESWFQHGETVTNGATTGTHTLVALIQPSIGLPWKHKPCDEKYVVITGWYSCLRMLEGHLDRKHQKTIDVLEQKCYFFSGSFKVLRFVSVLVHGLQHCKLRRICLRHGSSEVTWDHH